MKERTNLIEQKIRKDMVVGEVMRTTRTIILVS
jgi:hypothetical protein